MTPLQRIFLRSGGWIAIFIVWLGLIIAFSGSVTLQNQSRLAQSGADTTATVTKKSSQYVTESRSTGSGSGGGHTEYWLDYALATPSGLIPYKTEVTRAFYESTPQNGEILVRYLPEHPEIHELYEGQLHKSGMGSYVVGFAFTFIGMATALGFGLYARKATRLAATGTSIQATIVAIKRIGFISRLRFGFKAPDGKVYAYYSFYRFEPAHNGLKVRDMIEVKYDPANTRYAFWTGDLEARN